MLNGVPLMPRRLYAVSSSPTSPDGAAELEDGGRYESGE